MATYTLITGGSTGIGLEIADRFARDGHNLLLVALPGPELETARTMLLAKYPTINVDLFAVDLSTTDGPDQVGAFTRAKEYVIEVLVNNAGFGSWGFLPAIDQAREETMIALNITALYKLTRHYLREMQARNKGHIIHTASIAAFQPNPYMATYGATKAFVRSFSIALEHELKDQGSGIRITTVCPPAAKTAFVQASGMDRASLASSWLSSDVPTIADAAYRQYKRGGGQIIPGRLFQFLHFVTGFFPESLSIAIGKMTLRKGL
jgi:uncharacterized protein